MQQTNDTDRAGIINAIKRNVRLLNSIVLLIVFTLLFLTVRFVSTSLDYVPSFSVGIIIFIISLLVFTSFYLSKLISRSSIEKLEEYENKVSTLISSMEHEIVKRKEAEENLRVLSLTDELTGLYNRRGFSTLAAQHLKLVNRQKKGIFILYSDMDNLKDINDRLGHKTGDSALIDVANIFSEIYRDSDVIARIGGDEFVILPIGYTEFDAAVLNTRLQKKLDQFNSTKDRQYTISLSIGIAYYDPAKPCSIDKLLEQADKLMYEQKQLRKTS